MAKKSSTYAREKISENETSVKNTVPIFRKKPDKITCFILSFSAPYRKERHGPYPLYPITNLTFLFETQIAALKKAYENIDIVFILGFKADKAIRYIREHGCTIIENVQFRETSYYESIRLALNASHPDRLLLIDGSICFSAEAIQKMDEDDSCLLVDTQQRFHPAEVGVAVEDDMAANMYYNISPKWAHIAFLQKREIEILRNLSDNHRQEKVLFFEVFNQILNSKGRFSLLENTNCPIFRYVPEEIKALRENSNSKR